MYGMNNIIIWVLSTILSTVDEIKEDVIEIKQCLTQPPRRKNEKSNKVV